MSDNNYFKIKHRSKIINNCDFDWIPYLQTRFGAWRCVLVNRRARRMVEAELARREELARAAHLRGALDAWRDLTPSPFSVSILLKPPRGPVSGSAMLECQAFSILMRLRLSIAEGFQILISLNSVWRNTRRVWGH